MPGSLTSAEPTKAGILVYVSFVQKLIRRRPFLIKNLENNLQRLLQSLEHYGPEDRKKLAVFTALTFSQKLGVRAQFPSSSILSLVFCNVNDRFSAFLEQRTEKLPLETIFKGHRLVVVKAPK